jgi:hypothetical protein
MKPRDKSSPIPKSGGITSFGCGFAMAIICMLLVSEASISSGVPQRPGQNSISSTEARVKWEMVPLLPKNFEEKKFVEANADVPENPPDETNNFSFRDQQAAQPKIDSKLSENQTPKVEGSEDTVKIVEAEIESQPKPTSDSSAKAIDKPEDKQTPLPPSLPSSSKTDLEKGLSDDGSHLVKGDGEDDGSQIIALNLQKPHQDHSPIRPTKAGTKPQQQPRPKLSPELIQGPLMRTSTSAPRIGTIAIESRLHPHGVYIQKMLKAIEEQWHQLALGSIRFMQKDRLPGALTFRFTLLSTGRIKNLSRMDSEGASLAAELCRQAIASRAPFGNWTEDMISDFGKFDEITIGFRYR